MISKNQIKYIQSLHLKKNREIENLYIIEGVKIVEEYLSQNPENIVVLYAVQDFIASHRISLKKLNLKVEEISEEELLKISTQKSPNQVLAIAKKQKNTLNISVLASSNTLYLDDIRDPGNLGTIIRIADWFGIKQVICSPTSTELYNPKTLQASMGAVLRVNVVYLPFFEVIKHFQNIAIYGALLNGKNIYSEKLNNGLIVIGNEANGISDEVKKHLTQPITIPSASSNGSESLNAANACAIICSEFYRQLNEA